MNGNQGNYEKEINLIELMLYCLKKWRWIVAAMLVVAVLAGAYKYQSVVKSNENKMEAEKLEEADSNEEEIIVNPNIEYYQLAIEKSEEVMKKKDDYLNHSVIMQLNANELQTGTLSFYLNVQNDETNTLDALITAYRAYVKDGRLAEQLQNEDKSISKSDLQYLITFSNGKVDYSSENMDMFMWPEKNVFQIQITAPDEELCSAYLKATEAAILEYSEKLQEDIAEHELRVLASAQTERMDQDIQTYQTQVISDYTTAVKNLQSLRNDLETVRSEEGETIAVNETVVLDNPVTAAVKFAIIGLVIGAFLAACVLALMYIMSGKLQGTDSFEEEYRMKLLGHVGEPVGQKKLFGFLDRFIWRLGEGAYANIPKEEQVKIVAANLKAAISNQEGLKKVMLAGTIAGKDVAELCGKLTEGVEGVIFSDYKQPVFNAEALEELSDYDAVVFLEKKEVSASKLISQEREQAIGRKVQILGVIVL